ncbi:MAG TPA: alkyl hydroperoxide reductase [Thermomicrobiaceae bacterium]|nr:alkyl hydroperoxide reductase [Thermomicrobiaceae bacterium]
MIGVHSPKFPTEHTSRGLRGAVGRLEIAHPVVNDAEMAVWDAYGVRAWPTLMFVDPRGYVVGKHEGEASADELADVVAGLIERYRQQGVLTPGPIPGLAPLKPPSGPLAFPGKVLADAAGDRLFVADSGHQRLVVSALDGANPWVIGSGEPGLADGPAAEARFHQPEGMALDGDTLYVADRANHAIRRVDLAARQVTTVAGTGRLGQGFTHPGPARDVDLRSPWDVALHAGVLYIAMAGLHQLWALDLAAGQLRRYAGTGHEGIKDGDLGRCWLAQPSGLDRSGTRLYFADSETSSIRTADLPPGDQVRTLVGTGLFDFGDVDGAGRGALLQHPLGVAAGEGVGVVYLTDTYNSKIKTIDLASGEVRSWLGSGEAGLTDGVGAAARFDEPGGLSLAGRRLYIADTNNHAIRVAEIDTGVVTTLRFAL